MMMMEDFKKKI
jgi:hypothetical protein